MPAPPGHRCDQTSLPARPQGATFTGQPAGCSRYTAVTLNKPLDFEREQKFFWVRFLRRGLRGSALGTAFRDACVTWIAMKFLHVHEMWSDVSTVTDVHCKLEFNTY